MLTYENFDTFFRGKAVWHQELAELKETTLRKLRANLFWMLHDEGFPSRMRATFCRVGSRDGAQQFAGAFGDDEAG
jgi:hypothetical protein